MDESGLRAFILAVPRNCDSVRKLICIHRHTPCYSPVLETTPHYPHLLSNTLTLLYALARRITRNYSVIRRAALNYSRHFLQVINFYFKKRRKTEVFFWRWCYQALIILLKIRWTWSGDLEIIFCPSKILLNFLFFHQPKIFSNRRNFLEKQISSTP